MAAKNARVQPICTITTTLHKISSIFLALLQIENALAHTAFCRKTCREGLKSRHISYLCRRQRPHALYVCTARTVYPRTHARTHARTLARSHEHDTKLRDVVSCYLRGNQLTTVVTVAKNDAVDAVLEVVPHPLHCFAALHSGRGE